MNFLSKFLKSPENQQAREIQSLAGVSQDIIDFHAFLFNLTDELEQTRGVQDGGDIFNVPLGNVRFYSDGYTTGILADDYQLEANLEGSWINKFGETAIKTKMEFSNLGKNISPEKLKIKRYYTGFMRINEGEYNCNYVRGQKPTYDNTYPSLEQARIRFQALSKGLKEKVLQDLNGHILPQALERLLKGMSR